MNLRKNLKIISERYPGLYKNLNNLDFDKISVEPATDGGIFYSLSQSPSSQIPLYPPENPLKTANAALQSTASRIANKKIARSCFDFVGATTPIELEFRCGGLQ